MVFMIFSLICIVIIQMLSVMIFYIFSLLNPVFVLTFRVDKKHLICKRMSILGHKLLVYVAR